MVEPTHLKKYSSNWKSSPNFGVKINNIWNHHLVQNYPVDAGFQCHLPWGSKGNINYSSSLKKSEANLNIWRMLNFMLILHSTSFQSFPMSNVALVKGNIRNPCNTSIAFRGKSMESIPTTPEGPAVPQKCLTKEQDSGLGFMNPFWL